MRIYLQKLRNCCRNGIFLRYEESKIVIIGHSRKIISFLPLPLNISLQCTGAWKNNISTKKVCKDIYENFHFS